MTDKGLFIDRVTITLDGREIVSLSRRVAPGVVLTVMGPSGVGKSTLLAYIGGFLDPAFTASGRAFVDGVEVTALKPEDRHMGILFQDALLFPHMSVGGNLLFALPAGSGDRQERLRRMRQALAGVGLAGLEDRDPATLSGGQKARVALARVLAAAPRALLLDEPFSKLDAALREQMRELVFSKARETGLPVLLVTHDEADAEAAGGDIVKLGE
ncbi:ATP-binding cassette domain-containing protein [Nitratireductor sp. ZSWI3]|uniref:ATP-binding cassette domain-containing protein n=1 Tax=Nitratireductor sp. ZSWI3 TaxID=2966359 RepID=UPI00214FAD1D|nr:ATP-binding cassette domain-containing protein [Nitratireductor sp. ZSWI3]MCR4269237.1 ATP-binding cassette domain-containing protein [Nitratireductor sp. ZSWI3]